MTTHDDRVRAYADPYVALAVAQDCYDWPSPDDVAEAMMAVADREQAAAGPALFEETMAAILARAEKAEAEVERLTHLLGSHADGHRCTCTMIDPGNFHVEGGNAHPPEWEQDPWCPTHPDVNQIKADVERLRADKATFEHWRDQWIASTEALTDQLAKAEDKIARVEALRDRWLDDEMFARAIELDAALRGPGPTEDRAAALAEAIRADNEQVRADDFQKWLNRPEPSEVRPLPLHRTEAGYPNCSTCDGGGCLDCTDPA